MSSKNELFIKKNVDPKEGSLSKISAVNICENFLITGNEKGNLITYEFGSSNTLYKLKEISFKYKIEKILVPSSGRMAFVLVNKEVNYVKIPLMNIVQVFKIGDIVVNVFLNKDELDYQNMILILNKKKELKMYEYEIAQDKISFQEKQLSKNLTLKDFPKCRLWISKNYFVYSLTEKDSKKDDTLNWLNLDTLKEKSSELGEIFDLNYLTDKVSASTKNYTLFMVDCIAYQYSLLLHDSGEFKNFCEFKNYLFALYDKTIGVFKAGKEK